MARGCLTDDDVAWLKAHAVTSDEADSIGTWLLPTQEAVRNMNESRYDGLLDDEGNAVQQHTVAWGFSSESCR